MAIPLNDGRYVLGLVVDSFDWIGVAFLTTDQIMTAPFPEPPILDETRIISAILIAEDDLDDGSWPVICASNQEMTQYHQYFKVMERIKRDDTVGIRTVGGGLLKTFVRAYFAMEPWDCFYDPELFDKDFLISPEKKPAHLIYKKDLPEEPVTTAPRTAPKSDLGEIVALDSDEGSDFVVDIEDYIIERNLTEVLDLKALINYLIRNESLPADPTESMERQGLDTAVLALAELLISFEEEGSFDDKSFGELSTIQTLRNKGFALAYIHQFLAQISKDMKDEDTERELVILWRESGSFDEWQAHMAALSEKLPAVK